MIVFDNWRRIGAVAASAAVMYVVLVLLVRVVFGKRTEAKMNTIDWTIVVSVGAIIGGTLIRRDTVILEGLTALVVLLGFNSLLNWCTARWDAARKIAYARPTLVYYEGKFLADAMRRERISREDIHEAARVRGFDSLRNVSAVVLESSGALAVVARTESTRPELLADVDGFPRSEGREL